VSTYITAITVETTVKGTAPATTEVVGYEEEYKQAHPGCAGYTPALPEGFNGRLYLTANTDGTFSATHYNAFKPSAESDPRAFLDCGGAGGVGGAAGAGGVGGEAGSGATSGSGGTGGNDAAPPANDDSGCSVGLVSPSSSDGAFAIAALAIAAALRRRRA
jgi:MYXO-CTERM domain-containing protein